MVKDTWLANQGNLDALAERLGDLAGKTVLDLGFGQGKMVSALVEAGADVMGVEVSETMRSMANDANRQAVSDGRVDLRIGDGVRLPFEDDTADAVTSAHSIYFMSDPAETMAEVRRVLRPGGWVTLAFISAEKGVATWMDPAVYTAYLTDEVTALLNGAGFTETEAIIDEALPFPLRWVVAKA